MLAWPFGGVRESDRFSNPDNIKQQRFALDSPMRLCINRLHQNSPPGTNNAFIIPTTVDIDLNLIINTEIEKVKYALIMIAVCTLFFSGCNDDDGPGEEVLKDYIEITSVEPEIVNEGEQTSFVVNFEYRLATEDSGTIYIGFNTNVEEPNSYPVRTVKELDTRDAGSDTITIPSTPVFHAPPESYRVYMNMGPPDREGSWQPLVSDLRDITVNQTGKAASFEAYRNSPDDDTEPIICDDEECF